VARQDRTVLRLRSATGAASQAPCARERGTREQHCGANGENKTDKNKPKKKKKKKHPPP